MKAEKILIADDNIRVIEVLSRFLSAAGFLPREAHNGNEALNLAFTEKPGLILLDVLMPGIDGCEVCRRLKNNFDTSIIPVILFSQRGEVKDRIRGFDCGADDYLPKPFDLYELKARIERILARDTRNLARNPLTRLPGNIAIEDEVKSRIVAGGLFAFAYIDIDNFKAYNDVYGYNKGDEVIQRAARLLLDTKQSTGEKDDFVGHVGGDDFVFVAHPEAMERVCSAFTAEFDRVIPEYTTPEHRQSGYIVTRDRRGNECRFPMMTVSVGVVTNERRKIDHYAKVVEIASEMKRYAKSLQDRKGSIYKKDRRSD